MYAMIPAMTLGGAKVIIPSATIDAPVTNAQLHSFEIISVFTPLVKTFI